MTTEFDRLIGLVETLTPEQRCLPGACGAWSAKDLLAHLDAWHTMFLGWEAVGAVGGHPVMPAPGYTWKGTPALNEEIWQRTRADDLDDVMSRLRSSYLAVRAVVAGYGDDLFVKQRHPWTGSTSVGSYAVSATSSHYAWAATLLRKFAANLPSGGA